MRMRWLAGSAVAFVTAFGLVTIQAQSGRRHDGIVQVPDSSVEHDGDNGQRAHTNHVVHLRGASPQQTTAPDGETPASLIPYYVPGYTTNVAANANPGSGVIVIVDAFDYPSALADFNKFSQTFG